MSLTLFMLIELSLLNTGLILFWTFDLLGQKCQLPIGITKFYSFYQIWFCEK